MSEPNAFEVEEARTARAEGEDLAHHLVNGPDIRRAITDEWRDAATRLRRRIAQDQRSLAHYLHALDGVHSTEGN